MKSNQHETGQKDTAIEELITLNRDEYFEHLARMVSANSCENSVSLELQVQELPLTSVLGWGVLGSGGAAPDDVNNGTDSVPAWCLQPAVPSRSPGTSKSRSKGDSLGFQNR